MLEVNVRCLPIPLSFTGDLGEATAAHEREAAHGVAPAAQHGQAKDAPDPTGAMQRRAAFAHPVVLTFGECNAWQSGSREARILARVVHKLKHERNAKFPGLVWIFKGHGHLTIENMGMCTEVGEAVQEADLWDRYHNASAAQHDSAAVFGFDARQGSNVLLKTGVMMSRNLNEIPPEILLEAAEFNVFNRTGTAAAMYSSYITDALVMKVSAGESRELSFWRGGLKIWPDNNTTSSAANSVETLQDKFEEYLGQTPWYKRK